MLQTKKVVTSRNSGWMGVYRDKTQSTSFGAKRSASSLSDLEKIATLAFLEHSKRQQDFDFAQQQGFTLSMKVSTRFVPDINTDYKVVIGKHLFNIQYIDPGKTQLYFYLSSVRDLGDDDLGDDST